MILLAVTLLGTAGIAAAPSAADAAQVNVNQQTVNRTKQEIVDKWLTYRPMETGGNYMTADRIYETAPSLTSPYSAGKIQQPYIEDGLNAANFVRYLAGLPDDLTADWSLEKQQQTGALVNAVNNKLEHTPAKPAKMDEAMFQLGYTATSSSNLFMGSRTFYDNVLGYMSDSDPSNIDRVGHRRWILNPAMKKTMFGMVYAATSNGYSAPYATMYAFNRTRSASEINYDYVAWPSAGYFPNEVFAGDDAWSVSLNPEHYNRNRTDRIKVELKRERDGREWSFDAGDTDKTNEYFNVETNGYGIPFAVIFRPDGVDQYDGNYQVRITGLYDNSGQETSLVFQTNFFRLLPSLVARYSIQLEKGESVKLSLRAGAQMSGNTYQSKDKTIAQVDANGVVKGTGAGMTLVSVDDYIGGGNHDIQIIVRDKDDEQVSKWAASDYAAAKSNGLIDADFDHSYQKPISRYYFTALAVQMLETALDRSLYSGDAASGKSPFKDFDEWHVTLASKLGIISGTSAGQFSPNATITREQAATLLLNLYNAALKLNPETAKQVSVPAAAAKFADDGSISAWAKDSVYRAAALSLMKGTGSNQFSPKGKLTYEQTYILMQNVFTLIEVQ
jgi:S-layer homology domain.